MANANSIKRRKTMLEIQTPTKRTDTIRFNMNSTPLLRKSLGHALTEDVVDSMVVSPLRRKSVIVQGSTESLSENNDAIERSTLRNERRLTTGVTDSPNKDEKRKSTLSSLINMTQNQLTEEITQCVKLNVENKISTKNAFNLGMIDCMAYLMKKQDNYMSNLQTASTALDVSAKIYGCRVDGLHVQVLNMMGGLCDQELNEQNNAGEEHSDEQNDEPAKLLKKRKRKKNKNQMILNVESLTKDINSIKPSEYTKIDCDNQSSQSLCQATLPIRINSKYYLPEFNDISLDQIDESQQNPDHGDLDFSVNTIPDISQYDICFSFANFKFLNWSAEEEEKELQRNNSIENGFEFDLDASVSTENNFVLSAIDNEDNDDNTEFVEIERCIAEQRSAENIVSLENLMNIQTQPSNLEYSCVDNKINIHWAGPFHWKPKFVNNVHHHRREGNQGVMKKKKDFEITFLEEAMINLDDKFTMDKKYGIYKKTVKNEWLIEKITYPPDAHFDESKFYKLFSDRNYKINKSLDNRIEKSISIGSQFDGYDYNNDNDISNYCPGITDIQADDSVDHNNLQNEAEVINDVQNSIGDNLIELPRVINKIFVPYSQKAKKIDIQKLKNAMWTQIHSDKENIVSIDKENNKLIRGKSLSDVYKKLPELIHNENTEALSFPIAFVSLLHLANEKILCVNPLPDQSDFLVAEDKRQENKK